MSAPAPARSGSGAMFDDIAPRYDLLNRLMSFGVDQNWRRRTVEALELDRCRRVLDLATGTGDLAIQVARHAPGVEVVGLDPSARMLEIGRRKVHAAGLAERVEMVLGDAERLPFEDGAFDGVCMAFGIRNVPDRPRALSELCRVTRPGGRVAILELSEPRGGLLAPLVRFHVHTVVPWLGSLISGASEYRYLQRSIAAFPPADDFAAMMRSAGLDVFRAERLTSGVCYLYVGTPRARA